MVARLAALEDKTVLAAAEEKVEGATVDEAIPLEEPAALLDETTTALEEDTAELEEGTGIEEDVTTKLLEVEVLVLVLVRVLVLVEVLDELVVVS